MSSSNSPLQPKKLWCLGLPIVVMVSKTMQSFDHREKFGIQFWQQPTIHRIAHSWCLVLGFGKLEHHEAYLALGV